MRKKLSLVLALLLVFGLVPKADASSSPFSDVPSSHWAYDAILEAYEDGVVQGTGHNVDGAVIFNPGGKVTIAQFNAILTRAFYPKEIKYAEPDDWAIKNYGELARNFKVGFSHGLFASLDTLPHELSRVEMAEMMYHLLEEEGIPYPDRQELEKIKSKIPDINTTTHDYAVSYCYYFGLLTGVDIKGNFTPMGTVTRAQTAVIYVRLKNIIEPVREAAGPPTLTNGQLVTEENVLALMEEYRNGKEPGERAKQAGFTSYMDRAAYDPYNPPYSIMKSDLGSGTECAKFAFAFFDDIFGTDAFMHKVASYADIRPGDLIHWDCHWAIAMERPYYEINFDGVGHWVVHHVGGGGGHISGGSIGWGGNPWSVDGDNMIAAYTRYPD